jgi:sarcosine oxidase
VRYDAAVIGLGGIGCAVLYEIAARGLSVVGFDRFGIPHDRGSTQGPARTFREGYFNDVRYVELARRSRERWLELAQESGTPLFEASGALLSGPRGHPAVVGIASSLKSHDLPHEELTAGEIAERWPALRPSPEDVGILEARAGLLRVPATVQAHAAGALRRGAALRTEEAVLGLSLRDGVVEIRTPVDKYEAKKLVVTLGPWLASDDSAELLLGYRPPLSVCRQPQLFFDAPDDRFKKDALVAFNYALPNEPLSFYGTPDAGHGVMLAYHYGGEETTADTVDRSLRPADLERVRVFSSARVPDIASTPRRAVVGLYTNTPDRHFLLGRHPATESIIIAGGFSGHGYKFAPVIGEIAADLVTQGRTQWDIELFLPERFT